MRARHYLGLAAAGAFVVTEHMNDLSDVNEINSCILVAITLIISVPITMVTCPPAPLELSAPRRR